MGSVDVQADNHVVGASMQRRSDRARGLDEDGTGATVQESVGLRVALDGHRDHNPLRRAFQQAHAHALAKVAEGDGFGGDVGHGDDNRILR